MRNSLVILTAIGILGWPVVAQDSGLQDRLKDAKQAAARNQQALSQYTWQEQQTIIVKGEVKQQTLSQVQLGPAGQPQKTPLNQPAPPPPTQRGPLRRRVVEKKTDEFKDYAQQVGALVLGYAHPDPEKMQQAFQQGHVSLGSASAGSVALTFHSYLKADDTFTLVLNPQNKSIQSVQVASYLDDPSNKVGFSAQFANLPDGTNHVQTSTVDAQQKQLKIQSQNSNYQKKN